MSSTGESPQIRRSARWYQFRLSTLLLITAIAAVVVLWQRSRIDGWLESLIGRPRSATSDSITVRIYPDRSVWLDGQLLLESKWDGKSRIETPLSVPFAARLAEFRQAGVQEPRAVVEAAPWSQMRRVYDVLGMLQHAGWTDIALRPYEDPTSKTPIRITPEGMPNNADE